MLYLRITAIRSRLVDGEAATEVELSDGTVLTAHSNELQDGPGALFASIPDGPEWLVSPQQDSKEAA